MEIMLKVTTEGIQALRPDLDESQAKTILNMVTLNMVGGTMEANMVTLIHIIDQLRKTELMRRKENGICDY